jgi:hypothetical protein
VCRGACLRKGAIAVALIIGFGEQLDEERLVDSPVRELEGVARVETPKGEDRGQIYGD